MMTMMKTTIAATLVLCAGLSTLATTAHADPTTPAPAAAAAPAASGGNYGYVFDDDKMLGKDGFGNTPIINVRAKGNRGVLHRPRVQFVQEMLKSVENM
jgi:hypothetical protein